MMQRTMCMTKEGVMDANGLFTRVLSFSQLAYLVSTPIQAPAMTAPSPPSAITSPPPEVRPPQAVSSLDPSKRPAKVTTTTTTTVAKTSSVRKRPNINLAVENIQSSFTDGPAGSAGSRPTKPATPAIADTGLVSSGKAVRSKEKKAKPVDAQKALRTQQLERLQKSRDLLKLRYTQSQESVEALKQQVTGQIKTLKSMEQEIISLKERVKSLSAELVHAKCQIPAPGKLLNNLSITKDFALTLPDRFDPPTTELAAGTSTSCVSSRDRELIVSISSCFSSQENERRPSRCSVIGAARCVFSAARCVFSAARCYAPNFGNFTTTRCSDFTTPNCGDFPSARRCVFDPFCSVASPCRSGASDTGVRLDA